MNDSLVETADYIIAGAGSAGCVLANRLSENPSNRVVLLEAGGSDNKFWVHVPVGYLYCMGNPETDWCYKTEAESGLNGRSLNYPRGKLLGGCSSINGMIYMRGQARDYDNWRQLGNQGWSWDDVLPIFRKSENHYGPSDDYHGKDGELRVERQRLHWPILDAVCEAAQEIGIEETQDFNNGDNEGVGYFPVNQKKGIRWNARKSYLDPAKNLDNLIIITHAHISRILFDGRRASGIEFTHKGEKTVIQSKREIILATGSIGTPQILQLSGIGPADLLKDHGIKVRHDLPGVGENLQDHLQIRTVFKISGAKTLNEMSSTLFGRMKIATEYFFKRSGPMAMAPSQLGIFTRSDSSYETPNIEYHVQPLSLDAFGEPLHPFPAITVSVCNLRPESRGTCHIQSNDAAIAPAIRPNYLSTANDRKVAADSIRHARKLMGTRRLSEFQPLEIKPGPELSSDSDLAEAAGDIATTIFHPVGTARMGSDKMSVVSDKLEVHGLEGLRIADASIMPNIVSGNTHAPVTMIAEKASAFILES